MDKCGIDPTFRSTGWADSDQVAQILAAVRFKPTWVFSPDQCNHDVCVSGLGPGSGAAVPLQQSGHLLVGFDVNADSVRNHSARSYNLSESAARVSPPAAAKFE